MQLVITLLMHMHIPKGYSMRPKKWPYHERKKASNLQVADDIKFELYLMKKTNHTAS